MTFKNHSGEFVDDIMVERKKDCMDSGSVSVILKQ